MAERDVEHGLHVTLDHFTTRAQQERALDILQFKLDVLWSMLDAIEKAYASLKTSRCRQLTVEVKEDRVVIGGIVLPRRSAAA